MQMRFFIEKLRKLTEKLLVTSMDPLHTLKKSDWKMEKLEQGTKVDHPASRN